MKIITNIYLKIGLSIISLIYIIIQSSQGGDFDIYLGAAELLKEGKSCYNVWIQLTGNNYGQYSYSPFFAVILIPFTYLPGSLSQFLWLMLDIVLLYRIWKIITIYLNLIQLSRKQYILWFVITLLASLRFILHNFEMVQLTIFLVYCCLESIYQAQMNNYVKSGLVLSIGIIVKIIPVVLIPYLLYRRKYKPLLIVVLALFIFLIIPSSIFGFGFNSTLLSEWWSIINPMNHEYLYEQNLNGEGVHSLSGLIAGYFTNTESRVIAPVSRIVFVANHSLLLWMVSAFRTILIALTFFFLRSLPLISFRNNYHTFWELSYILAITPLIFPHQQKYAFFFLLPATAYVVHFLISIRKQDLFIFPVFKYRISVIFFVLFFLLSTITTDGLIGNYLNDLSEYYKTITFGTFFLLITLYICKPKFLKEYNNK